MTKAWVIPALTRMSRRTLEVVKTSLGAEGVEDMMAEEGETRGRRGAVGRRWEVLYEGVGAGRELPESVRDERAAEAERSRPPTRSLRLRRFRPATQR